MAQVATNTHLPLGAISVHRAVTFVTNLVARISAWNDRRRTIAMLEALSDRQLDDIGLTRSDIDQIARGF